MRNVAWEMLDPSQPKRRRGRLPLVLCMFFLTIGLGPLALEGAAICLSHWKQVMSVPADVETPALDSTREWLRDTSDEVWWFTTPCFRQLPWDPKVVLPAAAVVMAFSMLMLRR